MNDETENVEKVEDAEPTPSADQQAETAFAEAAANAVEDGAVAKTPEPVVKEPEKPAEAKVDETKPEPTPEEKAAAEAKAKVDTEVSELKLKGKSAERFRELSSRPTKEEVEKQIAPIRELAQQAEQFNEIIRDTRANPQQIGTAFKYLKAINSGDRELMRGALKSMNEEVTWLAKTLGEPVGGFDPVTEHDDLNERLESGNLTADVAREVAQARAQKSLEDEQRQISAREAKERDDQKASMEAAMGGVNALNDRLKAIDPHFPDKLKALKDNGTIDLIRENMHPSRWAAAVEAAYLRIPNPAPKAPVSAMPLRPSGSPASSMARTPKDAEEAFAMGVEQARASGA
jgi:cell division septation protein DedD